MKIVVGNPVRNDDFFGRQLLLDKIWDVLEADSIVLAAPRRVGKTSLLLHLHDHPKPGTKVVYFDVEGLEGPEALVAEMLAKIGEMRGNPAKFLTAVLNRVESVGISALKMEFRKTASERWQDEGLKALLEVGQDGQQLILIIDELPILLHKLISSKESADWQRANQLLDWLRFLRMHERLNQHLRLVLAGSVGLSRVASQMGASHKLNDLRYIDVDPLNRDEARRLAKMLLASRGVSLPDDLLDVFLDQIDSFLPIFVQMMAAAVASSLRETERPVSADLIVSCYKTRVLGNEFRGSFADYYERLDRYYTQAEARAAKRLLRELAVASRALSKKTLLASYLAELGTDASPEGLDMLLTWLADDFYVTRTGNDCYAFRVRWLRDWWRQYHG